MRSAIFVLSVLVAIAHSAPFARPSRNVETTFDLEYSRGSEYDRKHEVEYHSSPDYFDDDDHNSDYFDDDDHKYKIKESAPKQYEKETETEFTLEYDRNVSYDKKKQVVRSKRSVCKDC